MALDCLDFEKIAFFAFGDRQTDGQMDSIDTLSRSRCHERRPNKITYNKKLSWLREARIVVLPSEKVWRYFYSFRHNTRTWQTNRRTFCRRIGRAMHSVGQQKWRQPVIVTVLLEARRIIVHVCWIVLLHSFSCERRTVCSSSDLFTILGAV